MTDYEALCERLRKALLSQKCSSYMDGSGRFTKDDVAEAADAIAALVARVAGLQRARDACERQYQDKVQQVLDEMHRAEAAEARAKELEAEVKRLDGLVDAYVERER